MAICAEWLKRRMRLPLPVGNSPSPIYPSKHICIQTQMMDAHEYACHGSKVGTACLSAVRMCDEAHVQSRRTRWALP